MTKTLSVAAKDTIFSSSSKMDDMEGPTARSRRHIKSPLLLHPSIILKDQTNFLMHETPSGKIMRCAYNFRYSLTLSMFRGLRACTPEIKLTGWNHGKLKDNLKSFIILNSVLMNNFKVMLIYWTEVYMS